jgi:hypothetical protein
LLIDNLRYDQWKAIQPIFAEIFRIAEEETFYSILPTANAVLQKCGLQRSDANIDIEKQFPALWKNDEEEGGKNLHEEELFRAQLKRLKREDVKFSYNKIPEQSRGAETGGQCSQSSES